MKHLKLFENNISKGDKVRSFINEIDDLMVDIQDFDVDYRVFLSSYNERDDHQYYNVRISKEINNDLSLNNIEKINNLTKEIYYFVQVIGDMYSTEDVNISTFYHLSKITLNATIIIVNRNN